MNTEKYPNRNDYDPDIYFYDVDTDTIQSKDGTEIYSGDGEKMYNSNDNK